MKIFFNILTQILGVLVTFSLSIIIGGLILYFAAEIFDLGRNNAYVFSTLPLFIAIGVGVQYIIEKLRDFTQCRFFALLYFLANFIFVYYIMEHRNFSSLPNNDKFLFLIIPSVIIGVFSYLYYPVREFLIKRKEITSDPEIL
ncbi:hypothetical protein [Marinigracilibium pacificum]|uniref:Uncharacterized protein n=1 Tax=Marinigracilibium pacificum TaxID=2729599 RepID=A0A848J5J5_9BACT|nr:hypothetical protein [Marinigracilibium pacificum]NMM50745.1 hypothetical protein [Marinigracilibium pacificum]